MAAAMSAAPQATVHRCPHCGKAVLSPAAQATLDYARKAAAERGGYIWEGARPQYEIGHYQDAELNEMLAVGAIEPHPDPTKGWIVKW